MFTAYDKALAPLLVAGVLTLLGFVGITESMTVGEVVTLAVAAILTYLVPNKKK